MMVGKASGISGDALNSVRGSPADEQGEKKRRYSIKVSPKIYDRLSYFKQKYEERLGKQISWDDFFASALFLGIFRKMVEGSE
jgi:hypothetical protein